MPLARHDNMRSMSTAYNAVSTHMPLARHDAMRTDTAPLHFQVSTHMPLARHDLKLCYSVLEIVVSTHMPLARHDALSARP